MSQKENTKGKTKRQWTGEEVARLRTLRARHSLCKTSEIIALYNQNASEPRTEEAVKGKLKKLAAAEQVLGSSPINPSGLQKQMTCTCPSQWSPPTIPPPLRELSAQKWPDYSSSTLEWPSQIVASMYRTSSQL
ncbi:hypothetical protein ACMFMG_002692 [Clarireedia jacksonii]